MTRSRSAPPTPLIHKKAQRQIYAALPLGYRDDAGKLVPVHEEQVVVSEIRNMRADGKTLREIADGLNSRGIVGKRGGKYHASIIKAILGNTLHAWVHLGLRFHPAGDRRGKN